MLDSFLSVALSNSGYLCFLCSNDVELLLWLMQIDREAEKSARRKRKLERLLLSKYVVAIGFGGC